MDPNASSDEVQMQALLSPTTKSPAVSISRTTPDFMNKSSEALVETTSVSPTRKRWYQKEEFERNPDAELCLKAEFNEWFWALLFREILPIAGIITAIVFGSISKLFSFNPTSLLGIGIDVDLQLALVGFLNKILDTVVQASLKHTASICLTTWMAFDPPTSSHAGVNLLDFELKEELVQPWTCISNFWKRWRLLGKGEIGWKGVLRFLVCLAVSICVVLLALAINTLGIPKERWYPNTAGGGWTVSESTKRALTVTSPKMVLNGMDWMNYWQAGFGMVGAGDPSWDAAIGLGAASTYSALSGISPIYQSNPAGWLPVGNEIPGSITAVNTVVNGSTVQSVSVQNSRVRDVFNYLQNNGSEQYYKVASGWTGTVNITVPVLKTTCFPGLPANSSIPIGTMPIQVPTDSTITIPIGAIPLLSFTGATCNLTVQQAIFPVGTWIVSMAEIDVSINNYGVSMNSTPIFLPYSAGDISIAQSLSIEIGNVVGRMNGLITTGLVYHMVLMSRYLASVNPGFLTVNDTAGLAPVIGVIAQHLLTIGAWDMVPSPTDETVTSCPIRWQVYGAGPRLPWEWATVAVVVVILLALLAGAVLKAKRRMKPGPWLEVGGMMLVANESEVMSSGRGSCGGEASEIAKKGRFYMRDVGNRDGEGAVRLVEKADEGERVSREKVYVSEEPRMVVERGVNWGLLWR